MPTYKFHCVKCGLMTEANFKITECDDEAKFPKCTKCGDVMQKTWIMNENGHGFVLKGRGWFKKGGY